MITDEDRYCFEYGDCHTLALALHGMTGWQLAALGVEDEACGGHVFIVLPTGEALDIRGVRPVGDLLAQYRREQPDGVWTKHNRDGILHNFGTDPYEPDAPQRARVLAEELITQALDRMRSC